MLHGQAVVAKILRRFANSQVNPLALTRFQSWRGQGGLHLLKQTIVIARNRAATDQLVVAPRQQWRDGYRAFEACAGFVEAAELRKKIAEQLISHAVPGIGHQRLSQHLFGFLIAILDQQRPRLTQPAEVGSASGRRRAAETTDRLVEMAENVDQSTGAEPRLGQGWEQSCGAVVRSQCPRNVAQLFEGNSQAEMGIGVARFDSDRAVQCRDGIRQSTGLEAGEAEIVLNKGIGWLL